MQIQRFSNGGFVVHKAIDSKTSAWFDAAGNLLDAEHRDSLNRTRPVVRGGERWRRLEHIGRQNVATKP